MSKRYLTVAKNDDKEYTKEQKEAYGDKVERRIPHMVEGVFCRFADVTFRENNMEIDVVLETLEGDELHEAEKKFGVEHRNILGYLREENENNRWVEKIVPIVAGEDFDDMIRRDEFFECCDVDEIDYPEQLEPRIEYFEEAEEFNFKCYNYLVFIREGDRSQYKFWVQAYKFLENINLTFSKKK